MSQHKLQLSASANSVLQGPRTAYYPQIDLMLFMLRSHFRDVEGAQVTGGMVKADFNGGLDKAEQKTLAHAPQWSFSRVS